MREEGGEERGRLVQVVCRDGAGGGGGGGPQHGVLLPGGGVLLHQEPQTGQLTQSYYSLYNSPTFREAIQKKSFFFMEIFQIGPDLPLHLEDFHKKTFFFFG